MYKLFATLSLLFALVACDRKNDELWNIEREQIRTYLKNNGITDYVEDEKAGLFYYFTDLDSIGTGRPNVTSVVEMNYSIRDLAGNTLFATASGEAEMIDLDAAIVGWQLGLPNFYRGSKVVLILPSRLAYGENGFYDAVNNINIPANSILLFDMEIVEIHPHF